MSYSSANNEISDTRLIEQIRDHDDMKAWETLMKRYSSKAFHIAYAILGQHHDAEEVTQDAFIRIYRALAKFRGDSEFSTWMYRIVVNQARNRYRWNKRRGAHLTVSINQELELNDNQSLTIDLPDTSKTPDQDMAFREWEKEIAKEMQNLPSVNREALILRNVKNLSYEQIAQILNCKVGTVKSRIARAREELRKRLGMDKWSVPS